MSYLKKNKRQIFFAFFLCLSYNLYFIFLLPEVKTAYLTYLDVLLSVVALCFFGADYLKYRNRQKKKTRFLQYDSIISQEFADMEDYDILEHDAEILKAQLQEQFEVNCNLQDYIGKWCHEVKLPLAASLLMIEKIEDAALKNSLREQMERINGQLKAALLGCKVQSSLFDIQIKSVSLLECVRAAVRNNQFFLIHNHFQLTVNVEEILVYTDKNWFVYVLDQLISNAIKYAAGHPVLNIWSSKEKDSVRLYVEDGGEGIKDSDIRRIFEKGYIGSSHHNGKYKSTGMGLYMAAKIVERLGHTITAESEPGKYARFIIAVKRLPDLTKL